VTVASKRARPAARSDVPPPRAASGVAPKRAGSRGRILVADGDDVMRSALAMLLESAGFETVSSSDGAAAARHLEESAFDVLVVDLDAEGLDGLALLRRGRAIDRDVVTIVTTALPDAATAERALREGAEYVLTRPLRFETLVHAIDTTLERRALVREATELRERLHDRARFENIVGFSPPMQRVFETVAQVAPSRASVLVTGESGTGKELIAQAIHERSPRRAGPFVKVHCAALAESLLESELFGHERGAFTGSVGRREGRFKLADGGTLFLDEVGEVSPSVQVKLLRFLQERTFERVGGNETLKVDVRILAATHRDLAHEVAAGRFREDLFYRLNVVNVELPPLRARASDIAPLALHFLRRFAAAEGKPITGFEDEAVARMTAYRWPGNVRELENTIERAVVLCDGPLVRARHLPAWEPPRTPAARLAGVTLAEVEREAILATFESVGRNAERAARVLGVSVRKVQYRLREYGVKPSRERARARPGKRTG
jgi:DNA-binding NtrC family response regulator